MCSLDLYPSKASPTTPWLSPWRAYERYRQASRTNQTKRPGQPLQGILEALRVLPLGTVVDGTRSGQPGTAAQIAALFRLASGNHYRGQRHGLRQILR